MGRQAYDKIAEGKVVREPKRSVGDMLMEHRDEEAVRSEQYRGTSSKWGKWGKLTEAGRHFHPLTLLNPHLITR